MGPRRPGVVALGLMLMAVLMVVLLTGTEPKPMSGRSVAAAAVRAPAEAVLPPALVGTEVVGSPREPSGAPAPVGMPVRLESAGATIDLRLDSYRTVSEAPEPAGRAPDGYRWLLLKFHVTNVAGDDWRVRLFDEVSAIDDRGQSLWAVGNGQVPCSGHGGTTLGAKAGADIDACGVVPLPNATPVVAVEFSSLRYSISVPAVAGAPAPGTAPPVANLIANGIPIQVRADVVLTPSGYFTGLEPALSNTRYVVARVAMSVGGKRDLLPINSPYLLDDRGALLESSDWSWELPGCRGPLLIVHPGEPDWGCYVFAVDADVPIAGVTWGPDPARFGEWPRWAVH